MSQARPYLVHARSACPDHDEMLRAVAAEFRLVDDRAIAVLDSGCGHELVLAVILAEVGIRAGVPLRPVGVGDRTLVAHAGIGHDGLVLDPVRGGAPMHSPGRDQLHWLCAHQVALRLLRGLMCAFQHVGDIGAAIRAGQLLLELPLGDEPRRSAELGLAQVRARLN